MKPGQMITAGIGGVIAIIIALVTYPILQSAADTLYLEYVPSCLVGTERFLRAYPANADGRPDFSKVPVTVASEDNCVDTATAALTAADGLLIFSEHGERVGKIAENKIDLDSSATFVQPYAVLQQYSGISTLVLSILPILSVTGFLGMSAANLYKYTRGDAASIQGIVTQTIGTLLVVIIGLYLAPTIFSFLQDAFAVSEGNRYSIMARFQTIIVLVFSFVPVIFCAGMLVMFGKQGMSAYSTFNESRGGAMM